MSDKSHSQGYPDVTDGDADKSSFAYLLGMGVGHAFVNNAGTGGRMSLGPSHGGSPSGGAAEPVLIGICFIAGTSIHTPAGIRNIEDIQVGDMVYSVQPGTSQLMQRPVVRVFVNSDLPIIRLTIGDGGGRSQVFGVTPEHPFWVIEKGWVPARELLSGDALQGLDQEGWHVIAVVDSGERADTFNFEVQDLHNYFVGQDGVLVHNVSKLKSGVPGPDFVPSPNVAKPYVRPSGAGPTAAQKASVQGKPCVDCGALSKNKIADHKDPLVVQHYREGSVNIKQQSSLSAVQPHCASCSPSQVGQLSAFSRRMKESFGF